MCVPCYSREYHQANRQPDPDIRRAEFLAKRARQWGLNLWDLALMLAIGCPCCGNPFHTNNVPYFDHDHATGQFRGLLCAPCNKGLGAFRDNPKALTNAAEYVQQTVNGYGS